MSTSDAPDRRVSLQMFLDNARTMLTAVHDRMRLFDTLTGTRRSVEELAHLTAKAEKLHECISEACQPCYTNARFLNLPTDPTPLLHTLQREVDAHGEDAGIEPGLNRAFYTLIALIGDAEAMKASRNERPVSELGKIAWGLRALKHYYPCDKDAAESLAGANLIEAVKLGAFGGAEYVELRHLLEMPETRPDANGVDPSDTPIMRAVGWLLRKKKLPDWVSGRSDMWFPDAFTALGDLIEAQHAQMTVNTQRIEPGVNGGGRRRRGRLGKEDAEAKRAQLLATIREHPSLKDDASKLANMIGVSESTVRRWIADEERKYRDSRAARAADDDEE